MEESKPVTHIQHMQDNIHRFGEALQAPSTVKPIVFGTSGYVGDIETTAAKEDHEHGAVNHPTPVGSIVLLADGAFTASTLPCNGAAVSRTTYAVLFGTIGVLFGPGDGVTTFNVPNIAGPVANTSYNIRFEV